MLLLIVPDLNDSGWMGLRCFIMAFIILNALICNLPKVLLHLSRIRKRNVQK